ncbi:MAG TPA: cupredoxin domain-containing protein [Candidatus Acidoferrum sp.]|nr:cupredoxin domain-containing protein [Candidatus Acidoferrum sp.]
MNTIRMSIVAAVLFSSASLLDGRAQSTRRIEVVASRFSFEPNEITVKKGEPVTLSLRSTDVTHGLSIEQLHLRVEEVHKGQSTDTLLSTATAGTFEGKCAHFCGKGHGSMVFTVHVVE